jgi:hypothetical protein
MASEGVLATLHKGWDALQSLDSPMALIGGLALTAWNHARYTRDADVLVAVDRQRIDEVVLHLRQAGFHPKHSPPALTVDGQTILQFTYQPEDALLPFQFDVLLADADFQRESVTRAAERRLPGSERLIRVVRPDDLIVIKLLAGRIIDRADAAMLLRENRDEIHFDRLQKAVHDLGLSADYDAVWRDAFPDEPLPPSRG